MVVDGAVVMVENILRHLCRREERRLNRSRDRIREAAHEVQRPVFYAITIIITAYLPIFTLQRVEGRLFRPMAWTVAFALLGALLFSMLDRARAGELLFRRQLREWENPVLRLVTAGYRARCHLDRASSLGDGRRGGRRICCSLYLLTSGVIGSEFLPHLDEGAIWVRGTPRPAPAPPKAPC